jgi:hypothetical protein
MGKAYSTYEERRFAYRVLVEKSENNRPFGRPRHRSEDNIERGLEDMELGGGGTEWIDLALNRDRLRALVNAVMNLEVP